MAVINTTGTFANNEQVTSTKLNNIADQSSFVQGSGGAAADSTLFVTTGGQLKVGTITATEMGTNSVEAAAIKNGEVTVAKLSTGAPTWTSGGNVTVLGSTTALSSVTASTASVSIGSARTASGASNIDFNSTFPLTSYEARISRESGANGNLVITNTGTGSVVITNAGANSLVLGTAPIPTPSGTAPVYGARAWGCINGIGATQITGTAERISGSSTVTLIKASHGFSTGDRAYFNFTATNILDGVYSITYVDNNTFTITTVVTTSATSANVTWWDVPVLSSNSNISSVKGALTGDPTGEYFVNFKIPMPNANYAVNLTGDQDDGRELMTNSVSSANNANGFRTRFRTTGNNTTNLLFYFSVFA
jgi:hypothetical protein